MNISLSEKEKIKLLNSADVYSVMQKILLREEKIDREKEHFWIIGLAQNNRIQYIELVSLGGIKSTTAEPMNVFRWAVMKGCPKVIMIHNHPSGELKPSEADEDLTDRLIQVGRILDIAVIDHIIISVKSYLSFINIGLMEELQKSTKWVPQFELIDRIRKEEKKIREDVIKTEREKNFQTVAKTMKQNGESIEKIMKYTGLSKKEVEKIKIK